MSMSKIEKKFPKVIVSFKDVGETPLEVIKSLKKEVPEFKDTSITYAGRLDPMAEGVLLLLVGDEVHEKEEYLKLDKVYSFDVLFGFSTDSYDVLGKITNSEDVVLTKKIIETAIKGLVGTQDQEYPPYSSKPVDGKPLSQWAREERLYEIDIPTHSVIVKSLSFVGLNTVGAKELIKTITANIDLVKGDFRQAETKELWKAYVENSMMDAFQIASFSIECSSGTYVRGIVHEMGQRLGVPATTFHITRESIGDYRVEGEE